MSQTQTSTTAQTAQQLLAEFADPERLAAAAATNDWPESRAIRAYHGGSQSGLDQRAGTSTGGIGSWTPSKYDYQGLWPATIDPTWEATPNKIVGGTDLLTIGKPGAGKSTLANHIAMRRIEGIEPSPAWASEKNGTDKVVWRGSSSRSEWLPLAPWTTLCLPAGVDYTASFVPRVPTEDAVSVPVDQLEGRVVKKIARYENPVDLNKNHLTTGGFHVVYPDPRMRGLQELYEASDGKKYEPPDDRPLFHREDPVNHWWFGWLLARVQAGPYDWTTLILDEIGDIAPDAAPNGQFGTYAKINLMKDCWVDARKTGLSIYAFGHAEEDIHSKIRRKVRWRMYLNGTSNPTSKADTVGFNNIPMRQPHLASKYDYAGLIFDEEQFDWISWPEYYSPVTHKLKLERQE